MLPSLYTPVAVNKREVCASTRGFAGEMVIDISFAFETARVVEREIVPEVAVIVVLPVSWLVTAPRLLMDATVGFEELQSTD